MPDPFPVVRTTEQFERVRRDEAKLRPVVRSAREALGLGDANVERFADGSLPVYGVAQDRVLKLYPPIYTEECDRETAMLRVVAGRLPVPTPVVLDSGKLEDWSYLLMGRLRGESLAAVWSRVPLVDRRRMASELGATLRLLHGLPCPGKVGVRVDWPAFIDGQQRSAVSRQRSHDLDESWLRQIPAFLESTPLGRPPADRLLHTEIMREHLLVEHGEEGWKLTGLFDFEPAMAGAAEYEFAAVGLFFSCGDPELLRRVLLGYGYRESEFEPILERRLLAYTLLHRYSHLPWYLERLPQGHRITTLDALASHWWGLDPGRGDP